MNNKASSSELLSVQDLKTFFDTEDGVVRAVDGVNFKINKGETFALVGESGCGKSVTALSIMRLVPSANARFAGGTISLDKKDLMTLSEKEMRTIRGKKISMIFQDPMTSLNPVHTVEQQVGEVLAQHLSLTSEEATSQALELLDAVGIPDPKQQIKSYPHQLSGGMKQRVMIAIALAGKPDLLIADEPTTALDVTVQEQILSLLREIQQKMGMSILLITHDIGVVAKMSDRVAVMYAGHIIESASSTSFFKNPKHPYSIKLFASIPNRMKRDRPLEIIKGTVPSLNTEFKECRFSNRCNFATEVCFKKIPKVISIASDHDVRCVLFDDRYQHAMRDTPSSQTSVDKKAVPSPSGSQLLEINNLKTHFPVQKGFFKRTIGYMKAVDGVSLTINKGNTLALVGESGCGKTTIGKSILQLISPTDGEILFNGIDLAQLDSKSLRSSRSHFQIIFQDSFSAMNPRMTINDIIAEGMTSLLSLPAKAREARVGQLLRTVGLEPEHKDRYPHEFSGGQRQRICIARALAVDPELIVCDEPTSSLDVSIQAQILNLLKTLQQNLGLSYLFITHDLSVVEYLSHHVAVMYLGHILEFAPTEVLFDNPLHPYTKALLSAVPSLEPGRRTGFQPLSGDVPSPFDPPPGCKFQGRCPLMEERCRKEEIAFYEKGEGHLVRCWKVAKSN
ncbi:dipeptide ABC transporter ATP-binding protein [Thermodesulfobacteriota bacterium]